MNRLLSLRENILLQQVSKDIRESRKNMSTPYQTLMAMPTETPEEGEAWWKRRIELQHIDEFKDDRGSYCSCGFQHKNLYTFKDHVCIPGIAGYSNSAYEVANENEERENNKLRWKRRNMTILLRRLMLNENLSLHVCTIAKDLPHKYMNDCHMQLRHFLDDIDLSVYLTNLSRPYAKNIIHGIRKSAKITFDQITTDLNITFEESMADDNPYTLLFMTINNVIFPLKVLDLNIKVGNKLEIVRLSDYSLDYVEGREWRAVVPECGV
jgi:hypothetical protein